MKAVRPLLAISAGDPTGIGPELVLESLSAHLVDWRHTVIAEMSLLTNAADRLGLSLPFQRVTSHRESARNENTVSVLAIPDVEVANLTTGGVDPRGGEIAAKCISAGLSGDYGFDALVCAPLNKEALKLSGVPFNDELAYMSHLTQATNTWTMGVIDGIWTCAVTEHIPFKDVASQLNVENISQRIIDLSNMITLSGIERPKIAVSGLNPHCGEGGQLGMEEIEIIQPAIEVSRKAGCDAEGPIPADTIYLYAADNNCHGVVSLYHDQANIARKLLAKRRGCTVFCGLPIPVTTTAHGTAFDIVDTNSAELGSFLDAVAIAESLCR